MLAPAAGMSDIQTTTQTLSATVSPSGTVSVPASVNLTGANTRFGDFAGSLLVSYWARTSDGGSSAITIQASSEFSPAGGPTAASVTYGCSGATLGTNCSGFHALSTTVQTPVVSLPTGTCTGGGGACSSQDPNTVLLQFAMPSRPQYKTGTYSAQITMTISTI